MSAPTLERPTLITPTISIPEMPCQEKRESAPEIPQGWLSKQLLKSYISSLHVQLSNLGWVPQSILDMGCGDGTLLSYLAQEIMDADVVGAVFDADTLAIAQEKNCCRIDFQHHAESETLPFSCGQFDLVVSHGFLGHSKAPRHLIKEICRASAEGIIISVPIPSLYNTLKSVPGLQDYKLLGQSVFSETTHPIALGQILYWLKQNGMKIETVLTPAPFAMVLARKPQI